MKWILWLLIASEGSDGLRGHWLYGPSLLSASTGLRRGEIVALRWQDVDLKRGTLEVTQSAEVVKGKQHIKPPKTARSARTIKMPSTLVNELERHRKDQLEQRLKLGLGARPELVFTSPLGKMLSLGTLTSAFGDKVAEIGIKPVTFHGLRHTHITLQLKSGVCLCMWCLPGQDTRAPASRWTSTATSSVVRTTMQRGRRKRCCNVY